MDQKYLTDSESLSLNIEATCLLPSSPRNFQYEIKMDKYNPLSIHDLNVYLR